jgi:hypothetical protein
MSTEMWKKFSKNKKGIGIFIDRPMFNKMWGGKLTLRNETLLQCVKSTEINEGGLVIIKKLLYCL